MIIDYSYRLNEEKDGRYGKMKIVKYNNSNSIIVEFKDGTQVKSCYGNFQKGCIINPNNPSIQNRGYLGQGKYVAKINGKHTKEYLVWRTMFVRCYDKKYIEKHPTYNGCEVCKEWYNFQTFCEWFHQNYYTIKNEIMDLDKDFIDNNAKIYSPETCIFIPQHINKLIIYSEPNDKVLPIGVRKGSNNTYLAKYNKKGKQVIIGRYKTVEEAFEAYLTTKEEYMNEIIEKYRPYMPKRVYDILIKFNIKKYYTNIK